MEALVSDDNDGDELGQFRRSSRTEGEILVMLAKIEATQKLHHSQNLDKFDQVKLRLEQQNGRVGKAEVAIDDIKRLLGEQALQDKYDAGLKTGQSQTVLSKGQFATLIACGGLLSTIAGIVVKAL